MLLDKGMQEGIEYQCAFLTSHIGHAIITKAPGSTVDGPNQGHTFGLDILQSFYATRVNPFLPSILGCGGGPQSLQQMMLHMVNGRPVAIINDGGDYSPKQLARQIQQQEQNKLSATAILEMYYYSKSKQAFDKLIKVYKQSLSEKDQNKFEKRCMPHITFLSDNFSKLKHLIKTETQFSKELAMLCQSIETNKKIICSASLPHTAIALHNDFLQALHIVSTNLDSYNPLDIIKRHQYYADLEGSINALLSNLQAATSSKQSTPLAQYLCDLKSILTGYKGGEDKHILDSVQQAYKGLFGRSRAQKLRKLLRGYNALTTRPSVTSELGYKTNSDPTSEAKRPSSPTS